jgi:predicted GIY-YIG superfamily endonuclease
MGIEYDIARRRSSMPITAQWWTLSENIVQYEAEGAGVYELGSSTGLVVYIGSSNNLRRRLREHLSESATSCIKSNATQYRVEITSNYLSRERQLYDEFVRANGRPPRCNEVRPG